jgi:hypothetical protein
MFYTCKTDECSSHTLPSYFRFILLSVLYANVNLVWTVFPLRGVRPIIPILIFHLNSLRWILSMELVLMQILYYTVRFFIECMFKNQPNVSKIQCTRFLNALHITCQPPNKCVGPTKFFLCVRKVLDSFCVFVSAYSVTSWCFVFLKINEMTHSNTVT